MSGRLTQSVEYRDHLAHLGWALAAGRDEEARDFLEAGSPPEELRLFVEDNVEKRLDKLRLQLEFVAAAFDDFDGHLRSFAGSSPLEAYASADTDADQFLAWAERGGNLTPEQRDFVACQRARHAVEALARGNRSGHVRFQELWSAAAQLAPDLGVNPGLRIHLNPGRAWARFLTPALLDEEATPPADVLFFVYAGEISAAVLDPRGRRLVRELARRSPTTLDDWVGRGTRLGRKGLIECCGDLADMGLVAFS